MGDGVVLDVGPKDVDSAGDLAAKVGDRTQAKRLIEHVRVSYPRELVAALSRPEDKGRTKYLDAAEVEDAFSGDDWEDIEGIESARVYGKGAQAVVGIVFRLESGRSARGAISYSEFPRSASAYEQAVKEGGVVLTDEEDPKQLRRALEAAEKQLSEGAGPSEEEIRQRIREEAEEEMKAEVTRQLTEAGLLDEEGNPVAKEPYEGYAEANADDVAAKLPDLSLSELVALKEAEEGQEKPRKGVLEPLQERLDAAEAALSGEEPGGDGS